MLAKEKKMARIENTELSYIDLLSMLLFDVQEDYDLPLEVERDAEAHLIALRELLEPFSA